MIILKNSSNFFNGKKYNLNCKEIRKIKMKSKMMIEFNINFCNDYL